jgi:hypothetical protein
MSAWNLRHGRWWMVQWAFDGWLSFGIHIDFRTRVNSLCECRYGPYVDLHLGCCIVSIGRNPVYTGDLESSTSVSRGGRRA